MQPRTPLPTAQRTPTGTFFGLGPLVGDKDRRKQAFYPGPKPPPRVGEVIKLPIPPPAAASSSAASSSAASSTAASLSVGQPGIDRPVALQVVRTAPRKKVGAIQAVSAQFNQAMVPVGSLQDLQKWPIPLRLSPKIDVTARWLGTRTVVLQRTSRFPFSTRFTAEIAAGTRSATGGTLHKAVRWQIETPRVVLRRRLPVDDQARQDSLIVLSFNQKIDHDSVAAAVRLRYGRGNNSSMKLTRVPTAIWRAAKTLKAQLAYLKVERTVVMRAVEKLPHDTRFQVSLPVGSYSAVGPLPTSQPLKWRFSTYPKLKIVRAWCAWRNKRTACREGSGITLRSSTQPAKDQDLYSLIHLTPEPADLIIRVAGRGVTIRGSFAASTDYSLEISSQFRDVFGQKLGKPWQGTFTYAEGRAVLQLPSIQPIVIEQSAPARLHARVRNIDTLKLHLLPLGKNDLHAAHQRFGRRWHGSDKAPFSAIRTGKKPGNAPFWSAPSQQTVSTKLSKNALGLVPLDLSTGLLGRRSGLIAVTVEAPWPFSRSWFSRKVGFASLLVQITNMGITARWDKKQVVAMVARLDTGAAVRYTEVQLIDGQGKVLRTAKTDDRGMVRLALRPWSWRASRFLWVETGHGKARSSAFLRLRRQANGPRKKPTLRSFIWTDRSPYKPGERVQLSAMLRVENPSQTGGVEAMVGATSLSWKLRSARGIEVLSGKTAVEANGAFDLEFVLPAAMDLGKARFEGRVEGGPWAKQVVRHSFAVQHYRVPAFKVAAAIRPIANTTTGAATGAATDAAQRKQGKQSDWLRFGGEAELEVSGRTYFGTAMAGATAHYSLRRRPTRFRPPHHTGWHFGRQRGQIQPYYGRGGHGWRRRHSRPTLLAQGTANLDSAGRWRIRHRLDAHEATAAGALQARKINKKAPSPQKKNLLGPATYTLEVWVEGDARQRISARSSATVHHGGIYAGLKLDRQVIKAGKTLTLSVVAASVKGERVARQVHVRLVRLVQPKPRRAKQRSRGRHKYSRAAAMIEVEVGRCTAATRVDKTNHTTCKLRLPTVGRYRFIASVKDSHGVTTTSHIEAYAFGRKRVRWAVRDMGKVELIADKSSYAPGETATLLIKSPFVAARGLLTVERHGLLSWRIVDVPTGATAVQVKLKMGWAPNVHVNVTLFSARNSAKTLENQQKSGNLSADQKPRTATGHLSLPMALREKRIVVTVRPERDVVAPGETLAVHVQTRDGHGQPVRSRLRLWAVDEAVLALLGFMTPDPLGFFHRFRAAFAHGDDLRAAIVVEQFAKITAKRPPRKRHMKRRSNRRGGRPVDRSRGSSSAEPILAARPAPPSAAKMVTLAENSGARDKDDASAAEQPSEEESRDIGGGPAPTLRQLFAATAFYRSGIVTDEAGNATISVKLPDNTTTFRLMVVAEAQTDHFGSGDGRFTSRQPVILRAALPRFANLHDDFDAAAVLHNNTGKQQTFVVGARAAGVSWHDAFEKTVTLGAGASTEVRFRVRATQVGRATFQFAARVKGSTRLDYADAVQRSIAINLPATLEAFATYGSTTSSVQQPIQAPSAAISGFGGLTIGLSSTALSGLEDAATYLIDYPYGCAEQTASRLLPIAVLGELLSQFNIGTVGDKAKQTTLMNAAVKRLISLQHYDGGFKFWPTSRRSNRWISPWVTYALLQAQKQGATVPPRTLQQAKRYLRRQVMRAKWFTSWWRSSDTLSLWVLSHPLAQVTSKKGVKPAKTLLSQYNSAFKRIFDDRAKMPVFAQTWLLSIAHRMAKKSATKTLLHELNNRLVEKSGSVHVAESTQQDLRLLMHSSDRTDAIVLNTLLEVQPQHPLLAKLMRGLMAARIKGRWRTTQANAWALVATRQYFDRFERIRPNFTTQLWLGQGYLGKQHFRGRSLAKTEAHVPLDQLLKQAGKTPKGKAQQGKAMTTARTSNLVLKKQGPGRMYYRIGMRYAPKNLRLPALEQGFTVLRRYAALDPKNKDRVTQLKDGSWRIRAGTDVRVDLTVVVPAQGHYVVVDDPLPGGFEPQNPAFKTTSRHGKPVRRRRPRGQSWRWHRSWRWDHVEMRDDRILLFADRLGAGVYNHSYIARATTIGRFVVPPARVEEMYAAETFGRNATTFVEIVQ